MAAGGEEGAKRLNMLLLQSFYLTGYDPERDFYGQFGERMEQALSYLQNG